MNDSLAWSDDVPTLPTARIWTPGPGISWFCALGKWHALWVHWVRKRTLPCQKEQCPKWRHNQPGHWTAYLPGAIPIHSLDGDRKVVGFRPVILPLNPEQADQVRKGFGTFPGPLLELARIKNEKTFLVQRIITGKPLENLPPCPSVLATLYRVWGIVPDFDDESEKPAPDGPDAGS